MRGERGDGGKEGRREAGREERCIVVRDAERILMMFSPWFQVLPVAGFCRDIPISS